MSSSSSKVPSEMHGILIREHGDASVLKYESVTTPSITPKQVLVQVHHAGVNYIDTYHRTGLYPNPLPLILGREGSGRVVQVGAEVNGIAEGEMIVFFAQGAYAEYVAVDAQAAIKLPAGLNTLSAAAAYLQGITAHYLVTGSYVVKAGDSVLIHAAAGGTGALIVQMAKLKGATTIIGTVGSASKADIAKAAGCTHVINYSTEDFLAQVKEITKGVGVHAVYDGVGKNTWEKSMKSLRKLGTLVLFGNASGPVPAINPLDLTKNGSLFLTRPTLGDYIATREQLESRAKDLLAWLKDEKLKLNIAQVLPLAEAAESHRLLESRTAVGKIVLEVIKD